jgi:MFS family permease
MILVAMGLLLTGSVICAVSGSLIVLVAGRALQGTSSALIPLAIGMIRDVFPREKVTTAIGIVSATMGVGGTLGMLVTGLIADHTSNHHPVFWITAGLAAAGLVLVAVAAPASGTRAGGKPDFVGALFLGGWLTCLLLAISQGNSWGWTSSGVLALFAAAAVLCVVWVVVELKVREPLVRLGLLVGTQSLSANLASLLMGFSMYAAFTLISSFVQTPTKVGYGLGGSVLDVGLYQLPSTVTMLVCSALTGRIAARIGAAFTLAIGSTFAGLSYLWLVVSNAHVYDFIAFGAIQGIGFGIAYAALGTLAVQHVPMDQSGIASGINSLVRTAGGSVAGAVTAALLTRSIIAGTNVPTLHSYVLCFVVVTIGAALTSAVATVHGVRHRPAPGTHPVEALETS